MDEATFQAKLAELVKEIDHLPPEEKAKVKEFEAEIKQRQAKLKQSVSNLQESLDYLRLCIKYLLFDLEATRRENGYLRKMLEDQGDQ